MLARVLISAMSLLVASSSAQVLQGARASFDIAILEQAKDVYWDMIEQLINSQVIPDVYSADGEDYLKDQTFWLNSAAGDIQFITKEDQNEIELVIKNLSGGYHCGSFRAKEWLFIAKGHIDVELNTIDLSVGLKFDTQVLPDGTVMPQFEPRDVNLDINRFDIKIHISGNIWADFAGAFAAIFQGLICDLLENVAETALQAIPTFINNALAATDGRSVIPNFPLWFIDYQTPQAAIVTATQIQAGVLGIMYDSQYGEAEWSTAFPADMPYHDDNYAAGLQVFISDLSLNSVVGSFLEMGEPELWINYTSVVNGTALNTTCGDMRFILPGLADTYGDDTNANIRLSIDAWNGLSTSKADQQLTLISQIGVQVYPVTAEGEVLAVDLLINNMTLNATLAINDFLLTLNVGALRIDSITVRSTQIGRIPVNTLVLTINSATKLLVSILDTLLEKYQITIPSEIAGIFELHDLYLNYFDGYTYFGATPVFVAPATTPTFLEQVAAPVYESTKLFIQ